MTPSIAHFMRDLEQAWDAHQQALLRRRDLAAALASLAAEPAVTHIPAMTGATGRRDQATLAAQLGLGTATAPAATGPAR